MADTQSQREHKPKEIAPPPPPGTHVAKPQSAAAIERPQAKRMGFDVTRPFRYGFSFVKGTTAGLLDGMAHYGRKGMWAGLAVGILMCIGAGPSVAFLMMGAGGGLVAGSLGGALLGGATGGVKDVNRSRRREKYADELAEHNEARATRPAQGQAPAKGYDYRDAYADRSKITNVNFVRTQQQYNENERDEKTYWQDREANRPQHSGFGKGF